MKNEEKNLPMVIVAIILVAIAFFAVKMVLKLAAFVLGLEMWQVLLIGAVLLGVFKNDII